MAQFEVRLTGGETERVTGADGYQQEGPLTTFYRSDAGRGVFDAWCTRLASFRSAQVLMIRRVEERDDLEALV